MTINWIIKPNLNKFKSNGNKQSKNNIKKTVPFTMASKRIEHFGINLTKGAKVLYAENYEMLLIGNKEGVSTWKDILCSWIGRPHISKMSVLPKVICRFSVMTLKIPKTFFL